MTDQRSPKPVLNRNDRYIFGAVVFLALLGALILYSTRKGDEPTNQFGPAAAPETPAVPGGTGGAR
jgi:hypothetical protein